jgi:mannose-6-phosphate isomerase-like protein (cupin superfamily)
MGTDCISASRPDFSILVARNILGRNGLPQKSTHQDRIFIVNSSDVALEDFVKNGAKNVKVRYLIDDRQGSNKFSLRLYTVGEDGHTPLDQHQYEHHVYVLSGQGTLKMEESGSVLRQVHEGDSIFIPSNAIHQFINERSEPLIFLCVKGNPNIYRPDSQNIESTTEDGSRNFC